MGPIDRTDVQSQKRLLECARLFLSVVHDTAQRYWPPFLPRSIPETDAHGPLDPVPSHNFESLCGSLWLEFPPHSDRCLSCSINEVYQIVKKGISLSRCLSLTRYRVSRVNAFERGLYVHWLSHNLGMTSWEMCCFCVHSINIRSRLNHILTGPQWISPIG